MPRTFLCLAVTVAAATVVLGLGLAGLATAAPAPAPAPAPVCGCSSGVSSRCSTQVGGVQPNASFVLAPGAGSSTGISFPSPAAVTVLHNNRAYLGQCAPSFGPGVYTRIKLLGGRSISTQVSLPDVGCGCNVGMYMVSA